MKERIRLITLVIGLGISQPLFAGVVFTAGSVESRAFSGFTPDAPIVKDHRDVVSLPAVDTTLAIAGATTGLVDVDLSASASGGSFLLNFAHVHDGGPLSFAVGEGELAFAVDETLPFQIAGEFSHSGPGAKTAFFRLYDSPADVNPVYEWRQQSSGEEPGAFDIEGVGELTPGINYRLVYRVLLDNQGSGDVGAASSSFAMLVGDGEVTTQPGDTDGNGRVDLADLNLVHNNFGATGQNVPGDTPPFDGQVNLADLNAVRNHFGESLPAAVPEPSTAFLGLLGGLFAATFHRIRRYCFA